VVSDAPPSQYIEVQGLHHFELEASHERSKVVEHKGVSIIFAAFCDALFGLSLVVVGCLPLQPREA